MSLRKYIEKYYQKSIKDILIDLYITQDMSIRGVAKELSISRGTVFNLLKEYDISKEKNIFN